MEYEFPVEIFQWLPDEKILSIGGKQLTGLKAFSIQMPLPYFYIKGKHQTVRFEISAYSNSEFTGYYEYVPMNIKILPHLPQLTVRIYR